MPERLAVRTPSRHHRSNGASDLVINSTILICGSLLTFEHAENNKKFARQGQHVGRRVASVKKTPSREKPSPAKVVLLGGDNYRIGMGGGAVLVDTGQYHSGIELNAANAPTEMQKRAANVIRALGELDENHRVHRPRCRRPPELPL